MYSPLGGAGCFPVTTSKTETGLDWITDLMKINVGFGAERRLKKKIALRSQRGQR